MCTNLIISSNSVFTRRTVPGTSFIRVDDGRVRDGLNSGALGGTGWMESSRSASKSECSRELRTLAINRELQCFDQP